MIHARLVPPSRAHAVQAPNRFGVGLSTRSLVLLALGLIFILPAFVDRRALVMVAAWDAGILLLAAADFRRLPVPEQLAIARTWAAPLSLGSSTNVQVAMRNSGPIAIQARIADYAPPELSETLPVLQFQVPASDETAGSYVARPGRRGDLDCGAAAVTWFSAWHLVERWGTAPVQQTVRVYPDLLEGRAEALYLIRSRQIALEKRRAKFTGVGREFESLREYREGDERRDISWSASARRGKLVTRIYQPERSQSVWVLVDAGRLLRARVADRSMLDLTVNAALTLTQVALSSGDRVGLMAYGRRLQHRLAPARGAGHLRTVVEALATVQADPVDADHATVVASLLALQRRRALIVWLTEIAETAGIPGVVEQAIAMSMRHLVLFAVMRQPDLHELAASIPGSDADMYRIVAAQETLERREALLEGLRQRGALVVEVSPADLSSGVVDRYLEAKERGLI
jgi:uncharacterized protein (DUF58 family)